MGKRIAGGVVYNDQERRWTIPKRICRTCGKEFLPLRDHHFYCSWDCHSQSPHAIREDKAQERRDWYAEKLARFHHWLWENSGALAPYLNWHPDEYEQLDQEYDRLNWRDRRME